MNTPWVVAVQDAACLDMESLFYGPDDDDQPVNEREWRQRRAIQVCDGCPIRQECLIDELTYPARDQHGVRGGMTARARIRLLARWRSNGLIPEHARAGDTELVARLLVGEGRAAS